MRCVFCQVGKILCAKSAHMDTCWNLHKNKVQPITRTASKGSHHHLSLSLSNIFATQMSQPRWTKCRFQQTPLTTFEINEKDTHPAGYAPLQDPDAAPTLAVVAPHRAWAEVRAPAWHRSVASAPTVTTMREKFKNCAFPFAASFAMLTGGVDKQNRTEHT